MCLAAEIERHFQCTEWIELAGSFTVMLGLLLVNEIQTLGFDQVVEGTTNESSANTTFKPRE